MSVHNGMNAYTSHERPLSPNDFVDSQDTNEITTRNDKKRELERGEEAFNTQENDFPDGGFRAWLIVFGVSVLPQYPHMIHFDIFSVRQCVTLSQRTLEQLINFTMGWGTFALEAAALVLRAYVLHVMACLCGTCPQYVSHLMPSCYFWQVWIRQFMGCE